MTLLLWAIVVCGALSIVYGVVTTQGLMAADAGSARMQEISAAVREGASAYLRRGLHPEQKRFLQFLSIYAVATLALYSAIPYKTPYRPQRLTPKPRASVSALSAPCPDVASVFIANRSQSSRLSRSVMRRLYTTVLTLHIRRAIVSIHNCMEIRL